MQIIGTGLNGLIGSKLLADFGTTYEFANIDRLDEKNPIDITNFEQVNRFIAEQPAPVIVHFAAFTDVTKAWDQRGDLEGVAYQVNVIGTKNIVKAAADHGKHVIHISTAYVFDGQKETSYLETDPVKPIEWYGETKAIAETEVMKSSGAWTILRIDQPFRSDEFPKVDLAHRIIAGLKGGKLYPQFDDHFIGPTFIDDFVKVIDWVIRTRTTGLFHASSGEKWSDFEFANLVNSTLGLHQTVSRGHLAEYLKTLQRPYQQNTALNCEKLVSQLDFKPHTIAEAIQLLASR